MQIRLQVGVANRPSQQSCNESRNPAFETSGLSLFRGGNVYLKQRVGYSGGGRPLILKFDLQLQQLEQKQFSRFPRTNWSPLLRSRWIYFIDITASGRYTVRLYTQADFREIVNCLCSICRSAVQLTIQACFSEDLN